MNVARPFGTGAISTSPQLAAAYLNRDNYVDFIYSYDGPQQYGVSWTGYYGAGSFSGTNTVQTSFIPSSFALADFNRDGLADVTLTNTAGNEFWVVYADNNLGAPSWYMAANTLRLPSNGTRPVDVATGDVNRDNQPDIALAQAASNEATLFLNVGVNQFGSSASYSLSASPRRVLLEDLNADGYPELLAITADNKLQVFRHTGAADRTRYGTPLTLATGVDPTILQVADMDGDQLKDIVVGCVGDNTVRVYLNRSVTTPLAAATPQLKGISVFPNPAADYIQVEAKGNTEPLTASLLDALGRPVREVVLQSAEARLPVNDLPRGLYLLRLTGKAGSSVSRIALR